MNREEFEKWYQEQYAGYGYNEALATFERQQKIIDELREENPDVPCPACGGSGECTCDNPRYNLDCDYCDASGKVPLTKALEYRIKELETEIAKLKSGIGCINSKSEISQNTTSGKWTDRMIEEAR